MSGAICNRSGTPGVFDPAMAQEFMALLGKDGATRVRGFPAKKLSREQKQGRARKGDLFLSDGTVNATELQTWQNERLGIYFVVNNGGDTKASITEIIGYFAEFDEGTKEEQLKRINRSPLLSPSYVIDNGGRSLHVYWIFDEPITCRAIEDCPKKKRWTKEQEQIAKTLGSDSSIKDPSRVMRLPGAWYVDVDESGNEVFRGQAHVISGTRQRCSRQEFLDHLPEPDDEPLLLERETTFMHAVGLKSDSHTKERMLAQLEAIPSRIPSSTGRTDSTTGTRDIYTKLLWAMAAEFGDEQAATLMADHSPLWAQEEDLREKCRDRNGSVGTGSFFEVVKQHWPHAVGLGNAAPGGLQRSQSASGATPANHHQPQDGSQGHTEASEDPSFDELWAELESHADRLVRSRHSYARQVAELSWYNRQLGTGAAQNGIIHLLDRANRRRRAGAALVPRGGSFTIKAKPWAIQGLFRSGLNLLTGQPGAGKSSLAAYIAAQWLYGSPAVLGHDIHGPNLSQRQVLIIGSDQDRGDWYETLAPYGLATVAEEFTTNGEALRRVQLHERLEVTSLENGMDLGPDGLAFIRERVEAFGSGLMLIGDSLAQLLPEGIDEDKKAAAGPVYDLIDALGPAWGILLHHTRKAAGREQNLGVGAGRGSGAIDGAVSRVLGLGLIHEMQNGQMVAQESNPQRELISTKRGGATLHVVIRMEQGTWTMVGDAGEQRRQREIAKGRRNLTEDQRRVLDACDAHAGSWLSIKAIAKAIGLDPTVLRWGQSAESAALRQRAARLVQLGLLQEQAVGREKQYRAVPVGDRTLAIEADALPNLEVEAPGGEPYA